MIVALEREGKWILGRDLRTILGSRTEPTSVWGGDDWYVPRRFAMKFDYQQQAEDYLANNRVVLERPTLQLQNS